MKPIVMYFSRTGNTKRMAEAISKSTKATAYDIASCDPEFVKDFDLLILGTPVEGFRPARETMKFIDQLPETEGKKAIVFCTYAIWKRNALKTMAKKLAKKGYETILSISKKGVKPNETDFSDVLDQITKSIQNNFRE